MNPFRETYFVALELSNMCNYSYMHKECPASTRKTKRILPSKVVYDVLDTLAKYNYGKGQSIAFYLYSDSLNDPRLFKFVEYASSKCPDANIIIGTNGWYLNDVMTKELYESGATWILVTSYTSIEDERLREVRKNVAHLWERFPRASFTIRKNKAFDKRMFMRGRKAGACYALLTELLIAPNSKLRFCCLDINQRYQERFGGDLLLNDFETVILSKYDALKSIRDELIDGKRSLTLCRECDRINRWRLEYVNKGDGRPGVDPLKRYLKKIKIK